MSTGGKGKLEHKRALGRDRRGTGSNGLGEPGAARHRKSTRDTIQGITDASIRRLARRGGVKRISATIYDETRGIVKTFLESVIRDAIVYTEHAQRKTVTSIDIVHALERQGRELSWNFFSSRPITDLTRCPLWLRWLDFSGFGCSL